MCIIECTTTTIHGHRREALMVVLSREGSWVEAQWVIHTSFALWTMIMLVTMTSRRSALGHSRLERPWRSNASRLDASDFASNVI